MDHNYAGKGTKRKRITNYCCVPQCNQYLEPGVSSHVFPKDPCLKVKWETALRMGKPASLTMRVCSLHFLPKDYYPSSNVRHKLFPNAVPSQKIPSRAHDNPDSATRKLQKSLRQERAGRRIKRGSHVSDGPNPGTNKEDLPPIIDETADSPKIPEIPPVRDVGVQANFADTRKFRPHDTRGLADILCDITHQEKCCQVNFLPEWTDEVNNPSLTLSNLLNNSAHLFTFTGIHSVDLLDALVSCVEELAVEPLTNKKLLSVRERVIMCMVKIKENMTFAALGVLFGVCGQTCANYFKNMCPMLARVLQVMIPFPDQEQIRSNLPKSFKHFKHTRIILDCAETSIEKCKCLKCRVLTYSQYKKDHTFKINIGVTPSGLITEISKPYGGRASDKFIVKDSRILEKLDYKDGVMVDKGYRIDTECQQLFLDLIRPPFLKKKQQMSKQDAIKNAEIARARVHVERVIQRLRQYEFLCGSIPWSLAPYVEDVLHIVCGITNLGPPIIHIDKFM